MSKIPQGEWNAIAARYAQGESISGIAQSYGCTPPAIHYILKRNRQRTAQKIEQPLNGRSGSMLTFNRETLPTPTTSAPFRSAETRGEEHGAFRPAHPPPTRETLLAGRDHGLAPAGLQTGQPPGLPQQQAGNPHKAGRASAFTAGLDSELHGRAEAAIEAFRSSFDAALVEVSPIVRQRLRQAASDLMRVAARTTIVLDRLNASAERASVRAPDHLWSTHTGEQV